MSDERYMKLLTEINERGLDKNSPVEVMAVHNATGQTVKQLCGVYEKEVLSKLIEGYLFAKEQVEDLEAANDELTKKARKFEEANAAFREGFQKAMGLPCKYGDTVWIIGDTLFDLIDDPKCEHKIFEGIVAAIIVCSEIKAEIIPKSTDFNNVVWVYIEDYNKVWFTDHALAEKRLAELKEEKQ